MTTPDNVVRLNPAASTDKVYVSGGSSRNWNAPLPSVVRISTAFVLVRVRGTLAPETTAPLPSRTTPAPLPTASAKAQGERNRNRRPVKKDIWNGLRTYLARSKEFINPPENGCGYAAFLAIIFNQLFI